MGNAPLEAVSWTPPQLPVSADRGRDGVLVHGPGGAAGSAGAGVDAFRSGERLVDSISEGIVPLPSPANGEATVVAGSGGSGAGGSGGWYAGTAPTLEAAPRGKPHTAEVATQTWPAQGGVQHAESDAASEGGWWCSLWGVTVGCTEKWIK